jgi:hypothetical protein
MVLLERTDRRDLVVLSPRPRISAIASSGPSLGRQERVDPDDRKGAVVLHRLVQEALILIFPRWYIESIAPRGLPHARELELRVDGLLDEIGELVDDERPCHGSRSR